MNNKKIIVGISSLVVLLAGCSVGTQETQGAKEHTQQQTEQSKGHDKNKGDTLNKILGKTNWQGTKVYDKDNNDLTKENENLIGLAKYDSETGRYEFFDGQTAESRGDLGTFFITNDGTKRILISETMNDQAVVGLTELTNKNFTYRRKGKDKAGNEVDVFVEHLPYNKTELVFTEKETPLNTTTGSIDTKKDGAEILGQTLWNGTKVIDESGNDVTEFNQNVISLAKFAEDTNKYEFFNVETGVSRGDFGYFDVLNHNKIRAHVSIGQNKYGAALELTELTKEKFTYKRVGKDQAGSDITVFVAHQPYTGQFKPVFSF